MRTASLWVAFLLQIFFIFPLLTQAQTSWKGTTSTNWATASNWTAGVPTTTVDAIIGDANFTGINQPTISGASKCKSLTIGGAVGATLTLSKNLVVNGNITINANGAIAQNNTSLTLSGNWINNGSYTAGNNNSRVFFAGVSQTLGGTAVTTFRKITINTGSSVTLANNMTVSGNGCIITVNGTLNPGESPTYTVTATSFTISNNGKIKVNAATFAANYTSGSISINTGGIVEYSSTTVNQTISNSLTYSTLIISGTGIKSLSGNLPALNSSASTAGNIFVTGGTLDLSAYTANRGTADAGGEINVGTGAFLKIGGTNTFPSNYATRTLTLNSTVEYNGTNQTISAQTYGHLTLSSSLGAVTKTMPASAFTVEGNFTSSTGLGTSVTYTAAADISVNGTTTIGASTTFNGSSFNLAVRGDWTNAGTFNGGTSTVNFDGPGIVINGAGTQNFNNISFTQSGITAGATTLNVAGNISTSGAGAFTHNSPGVINMTGASKTISGTDLTLYDLSVSGSVSSTATVSINGNLSIGGSFTASSGSITMTGASKTISGTGTKTFFELLVTGSVTTAVNFSISSLLDVPGTFSASAGTATFMSTSLLSGTANLYNVTLNATSLKLAAASVLGIAGTFTITAGTVDVTSSTPNTVNFNGTGAQSVNGISYYNLSLSNGNTKTAAAAITTNGTLSIASFTTFNGGTFTHTVLRNWINNGTYTASTGTVQFTGSANSTLTGATTFNTLTVNKSASNSLSLADNTSAATVNMTTGTILTGSKTLTITNTRTGNGIILGTVTRTHSFNIATAYAFEGPYNTITFAAAIGVTSVTVTVTPGSISDYPDGSSLNREYNISIPSGTYTATLRLHYEDAELNGNTESSMVLAKYSAGSWALAGKTGNSTASNYVELLSLSNISFRWTCDQGSGVAGWNGAVSTDWNNAANWTAVSGGPSLPPSANDIVQIGTGAFTHQPDISTAVTVKSILFGSAQAANLSIAPGGSLTTTGNISGSWTADAMHTIYAGSQNLSVGGNLVLSNGVNNRSINLSVGTGTVAVTGSLIQTGNAAVTSSGTSALNIGGDYNYTSGTFSPGTGTVTYNGSVAQTMAPVSYYNLTINKSAGTAKLAGAVSVGGNLSVISGTMDITGTPVNVSGDVTISSGSTLDCDAVTINVGGNWTMNGTYVSTSCTVTMNGTGNQTISASNFNNLTINKSAGSATLSGNISMDGNLLLQNGSLDIGAYTANRTTSGGSMTLSAATSFLLAGANNFPSGFSTKTIDASNLVHYNGSVAQSVAGITYGNLRFSNGGSNAKTLLANTIVAGDSWINSGATLHSGGFSLALSGNWTNAGTFTPSSGTVILNGSSKTITGSTVFNRLTVNGSYTVAGSDITYNGIIFVTATGSYDAGSGTATVNGDLTNSGTLLSSGTTNFTGTALQTIRLVNALTSASTGIINFNGNISPVLNSNSSPQFATLNINNTAGINPSVGWTVFVAMNVNSGGIFNGGLSSHTIYGSITNSGTMTSAGTLNFTPSTAKTINFGSAGFSSTGKVYFGGSGQLTVAGSPTKLTNVTISNTNSAGIAPVSNWTIDSNFTIASDAKFIAGAYTHTVAGNIESDGELVGGGSTFIMSSTAGTLTASSATEFNHFTVAGTITPLTDYRVAGNFSNNGTYDGTMGALIMTGSNGATLGGTVTPSPVGILVIEKTGGAVVTQATDINSALIISINSGVLFTSTKSITQDAGGGILLIANDATLRLGGTNSLPGFSGYALDINSNVDYAGTTQTVGNAANYGNLLVTASGTKNAWVPFVVQGNLLISAGTLSTSTLTVAHSIAGNFIMTGGTLSGSSSTYTLNGTNDQTLTLLSNVVNLTINKASGLVNLGSNVTVNNVTNLTLGKINLGNYNFTVGTAGSITNYSPAKYFIATGTGTLVQRVTAGASKVFPVGFTTDYLPATIALTGSSVADNFNLRLLNTVYYSGTTGTPYASHVANATWMIDEAVAGGSDATITLQWPQTLELSGFNRNSCRLEHYTAGMWDIGAVDLAAAGTNPYSVSRSGFTSFSPFAVVTNVALPVTWLSFTGKNENGNNLLNWVVASEQNNDHYVVEVSVNGNNYTSIGKVMGAGTTSTEQHYSFTHYGVSGQLYYRIRQVDRDGRYSYSKVVKIVTGNSLKTAMRVLTNPVRDKLILAITAARSFASSIIITDMSGKMIYKQRIKLVAGTNSIELGNFNAAAGIYNAIVLDENGNKVVLQFIK